MASTYFKRIVSLIVAIALVLTTTAYPLVTRADDGSDTSAPASAPAPALASDPAPAPVPSDPATPPAPTVDASTDASALATDTAANSSVAASSASSDTSDSSAPTPVTVTSTDSGTSTSDASTSSAGSSSDTDLSSSTNAGTNSSSGTGGGSSSTGSTNSGSVPFDASTTELTVPDTGSAPSATVLGTTTDTGYQNISTSTAGTSVSTSTADTTASTTASTTPIDPSLTATTSSSNPTIQSGDSVALANILNILNTNFLNSTGATVLLNYIAQVNQDIDLRNASSSLLSGAVCQTYVCGGTQGATVNLQSDGTIQNGVVLNATSGGNTINDPTSTSAVIGTGNAYAGLNLINLANTNIINSNYLLVALNAFQGVQGDIVFPSLLNFLGSLSSTLGVPNDITTNGTATVANNVTTTAGTGDNTISSSTSSTITTGQSTSAGNVFNQLNSNLFGGSNVSLLFRVQGNWTGQIFGAPEGLSSTRDPDGNLYLFMNGAGGAPSFSNIGSLVASSTGSIANNINVSALTGQNSIANTNSAMITTGAAEAAANVLNIANTNIIGKNWIMAVINIFGDFTGNIDFGRPDLFAGIKASAPASVVNGSQIGYTLTVINNGDAPADNATLNDSFDAQHLVISNPSVPYTSNGDGSLTWQLGTIPAGGAVEITYTTTVQGAGENTPIPTTITAAQTETDNNASDNSDTVTVNTQGNGSYGFSNYNTTNAVATGNNQVTTSPNGLQVTRGQSSVVPDPTTHLAHEKLSLYNPSTATSTPVILHDNLYDPSGAAIADQAWNVGVVRPHEEVDVEYDARFDPGVPSGTYTLTSMLVAEDGSHLDFTNNGTIEVAASVTPLATTVAAVPHILGAQITHYGAPATTTPSGATIFATPRAHAAGSQEAAAGSAPAQGLLFWVSVVLALLVLIGAATQLRRMARQ